jgi:hypothetical protein
MFELVGQNGSSGNVMVPAMYSEFGPGAVASFSFPRLAFLGDLHQVSMALLQFPCVLKAQCCDADWLCL